MQKTVYRIRIAILSILLVIAIHQLPQAKAMERQVGDLLDSRSAVTILFVGNSRTFYNNMPYMVRTIADSAHSQKKYQITMYALPGVSLEHHWDDPAVQKLLRQKWDYVVLQGGSSEQITTANNTSFLTYGAKLANLAKANGSVPVLLVAWKCADSYYPQLKTIGPRYYDMIQTSYADLAHTTGAASVNVGRVWKKMQEASPEPLTVDGNHPTMRGSYLVALMFYRFFSGDDLKNVTYIPSGVAPEDADLLKSAAQDW